MLFDYTTPAIQFWNKNRILHYSRISQDNPTIWGPLLEKALAKIGANYANIKGGFSAQISRTLLGCPVFSQLISLDGR